MGAFFGALLSLGGGVAGAYAIVSLVRLGNCIGTCTDHTRVIPFLIGAIVAVIVASFFWRYAMVLAPFSGLATAAYLLNQNGVDLFGANLGFTAFIATCVLLGPVIVLAVGLFSATRRRQAQAIARDGLQAVATVQSVEPTGVHINHQPQVAITYQIQPLDGSPAFAYRQRRTIGFNEVAPRPGLRWPAWYLAGKTDKVAIGSPGALQDTTTLDLLRQFGIEPAQAYGFDPATQVAPPGGFGGSYASFD